MPILLPNGRIRIVYLRTLGHPALLGADGPAVHKLRKKDLALLVYLCVEGTAVHPRERLALLLWGESAKEAARHSLTQALGRLVRVLPPGSLVVESQVVRWGEALQCDAVVLLRGALEPADVDAGFSIYEGEFLHGFDPGQGADEFIEWADGRRADLRNAAVRLLESAGADAEQNRQWRRAVQLAEKAVRIDPIAENARRRLMRAWAALGERNVALRQYRDFAAWLEREFGAEPDPDTRALYQQLLAEAADPPHPAPPPARDAPTPPTLPPDVPAPPPPAREPPADDPPDPAPSASSAAAAGEPAPAGAPASEVEERSVPEAASTPAGAAVPDPPAPRKRRRAGRVTWIAGALVLAGVLAMALRALDRPPPPAQQVGNGENLRERGRGQVYLAFAETLYAYPDAETLHACTRRRTPPVREVSRLPPWPRRPLPSARVHPWIGDTVPIIADGSRDETVYVGVGCILAGIPDPPTLDSIFGPGALKRMVAVPGAVIPAMPRDVIAYGQPVRPAGTLIRSPGGLIRWITYHGGALVVADSALLATHCRAPREAVAVSDAEFRYYHPFAMLHPGEAECR